jgi:ABC-2 type transport system ATP-binding protein
VVGKRVIRDFLARVNVELGTSIVLTSHDMDDVAALCPRVVLIDHGAKRYDGDLTGLARSVRPAKQMMVTFGAEPRLPQPLPPGVTVIDRPTPNVLRLDIDRDRLADVLTAVPGWGSVVDLEVADADLDEVMATVFSATAELPTGDGGAV